MIPNGATFGGGNGGAQQKHTYTDFGMIPKSKITINPPTVKTEYVDIVGASGRLDYTQALTGNIAYDNRVGSIEFLVLNPASYQTVYSTLMAYFHGKYMNMVLDDDPQYFYQGRFAVNKWKSKEGASTIVLDYNLRPYKYFSGGSTGDLPDWLWDDLFEIVIYYGNFKIEAAGVKRRNLINPTSDVIVPKFTCSSPVTATVNNINYPLPAGFTDDPGFPIYPGTNYVYFSAQVQTTVAVDYTLDQIL